MADSGSDITVLPSSLLNLIIAADKNILVRRLDEPMKFSNAHASATPLECNREVEPDVELRIRHGERLILRNVKWLVSDAPMTHAYLGRHLLAALGMDNQVLMGAARDRLVLWWMFRPFSAAKASKMPPVLAPFPPFMEY